MARLTPILIAIIVAVSAFGFDATARADLVTYTASTSPYLRSTDFKQDLFFPSFNKNLGTLTQVKISYSVASDITGTVTNNAPVDENVQVIEATAYHLALGSTMLLQNALSVSQMYVQLRPNLPQNFGEFTPTGSAGPTIYTSGAIFDTFNGSAAGVALTFDTKTDLMIVGGGGNITTSITTKAGAIVTVEYTYIAVTGVPEPSSIVMSMVGGLLTGSFWLVKRRRRVNPIG